MNRNTVSGDLSTTDSTTTPLLTTEQRRHALMVEHCGNCRSLALAGKPWPEIEEMHERCHGWTHCDCCGGCPTCIADGHVESDLYDWEQTLR